LKLLGSTWPYVIVEYNNGSNNNLDQSNGDVIVGKIFLKKITIMTKKRMNIILFLKKL
jgi:hypothetical protein